MKCNHITNLPNGKGFKIFIPKSKTDIFRQGNVTFIPSSQDSYSPFCILSRFLRSSGISIGDDKFIFTPLTFCSSTKSYKRNQNRPLTYTRCRELFLDALKSINTTSISNYGLHSLKPCPHWTFFELFYRDDGYFYRDDGYFSHLSPVRTAQDVFLSVTFTESSGYFSRPTAAQEKLPSRFSRDD